MINQIFKYACILITIASCTVAIVKAEESRQSFDPNEVAKSLNNAIPILAYGIVNPFGPTLLGFSVNPVENGKGELISYSLNPFLQEMEIISKGDFDVSEMERPNPFRNLDLKNAICDFLQKKEVTSQAHGTPSFLFANEEFTALSNVLIDELTEVSMCVIKYSSGQLKSLEDFNKYPLDVWSRVQNEVDNLKEATKRQQSNEEQVNLRADNISDLQIYEILEIIISKEHIKEEFKGFFYAWDGAINFQKQFNNHELADQAVNLAGLLDFVTPLLSSMSQYVD